MNFIEFFKTKKPTIIEEEKQENIVENSPTTIEKNKAFKTFFEARQEYIDLIKDAKDKVSERPFNELFGDKDRFMIKIENYELLFQFEKILGYKPNIEDFQNLEEIKYINRKIRLRSKSLKSAINNFVEQHEKDIIHFLDTVMELKPRLSLSHSGVNYYALYIWDKEESKYNVIVEIASNIVPKTIEINQPLTFVNLRDLLLKVIREGHLDKTYSFQIINRLSTAKITNILFDLKEEYRTIAYNIKRIGMLKTIINEKNYYNYLIFTRNPVDVLRMSNHKGISSCHRLPGKYSQDEGMFMNCAISDAKNSGGLVYIVKGSIGDKIKNNLDDDEIFEDLDRGVAGVKPTGRFRLRRIIDLETGKDFAVPNTVDYGKNIERYSDKILEIVREKQSIYKNPPDYSYMQKNFVLVGGDYTDESIGDLVIRFFGIDSKEEFEIPHISRSEKYRKQIIQKYKEQIHDHFFNISDRTLYFSCDVMHKNIITCVLQFKIPTNLLLNFNDIKRRVSRRGLDISRFDEYVSNPQQYLKNILLNNKLFFSIIPNRQKNFPGVNSSIMSDFFNFRKVADIYYWNGDRWSFNDFVDINEKECYFSLLISISRGDKLEEYLKSLLELTPYTISDLRQHIINKMTNYLTLMVVEKIGEKGLEIH